eukprot:gnl/Dysnectes_brevis/5920_a8811_225.p1 GENE.gnl/Dysnectes_brevis/5920_a8811_225~~gnl/Dysnectes_brevis/5920_a8811_225.p1  ORF type:complete len:1873 (+),score=134.07 gnl/Dysnectes_brevis/5920_a8811_225:732-5621(+)
MHGHNFKSSSMLHYFLVKDSEDNLIYKSEIHELKDKTPKFRFTLPNSAEGKSLRFEFYDWDPDSSFLTGGFSTRIKMLLVSKKLVYPLEKNRMVSFQSINPRPGAPRLPDLKNAHSLELDASVNFKFGKKSTAVLEARMAHPEAPKAGFEVPVAVSTSQGNSNSFSRLVLPISIGVDTELTLHLFEILGSQKVKEIGHIKTSLTELGRRNEILGLKRESLPGLILRTSIAKINFTPETMQSSESPQSASGSVPPAFKSFVGDITAVYQKKLRAGDKIQMEASRMSKHGNTVYSRTVSLSGKTETQFKFKLKSLGDDKDHPILISIKNMSRSSFVIDEFVTTWRMIKQFNAMSIKHSLNSFVITSCNFVEEIEPQPVSLSITANARLIQPNGLDPRGIFLKARSQETGATIFSAPPSSNGPDGYIWNVLVPNYDINFLSRCAAKDDCSSSSQKEIRSFGLDNKIDLHFVLLCEKNEILELPKIEVDPRFVGNEVEYQLPGGSVILDTGLNYDPITMPDRYEIEITADRLSQNSNALVVKQHGCILTQISQSTPSLAPVFKFTLPAFMVAPSEKVKWEIYAQGANLNRVLTGKISISLLDAQIGHEETLVRKGETTGLFQCRITPLFDNTSFEAPSPGTSELVPIFPDMETLAFPWIKPSVWTLSLQTKDDWLVSDDFGFIGFRQKGQIILNVEESRLGRVFLFENPNSGDTFELVPSTIFTVSETEHFENASICPCYQQQHSSTSADAATATDSSISKVVSSFVLSCSNLEDTCSAELSAINESTNMISTLCNFELVPDTSSQIEVICDPSSKLFVVLNCHGQQIQYCGDIELQNGRYCMFSEGRQSRSQSQKTPVIELSELSKRAFDDSVPTSLEFSGLDPGYMLNLAIRPLGRIIVSSDELKDTASSSFHKRSSRWSSYLAASRSGWITVKRADIPCSFAVPPNYGGRTSYEFRIRLFAKESNSFLGETLVQSSIFALSSESILPIENSQKNITNLKVSTNTIVDSPYMNPPFLVKIPVANPTSVFSFCDTSSEFKLVQSDNSRNVLSFLVDKSILSPLKIVSHGGSAGSSTVFTCICELLNTGGNVRHLDAFGTMLVKLQKSEEATEHDHTVRVYYSDPSPKRTTTGAGKVLIGQTTGSEILLNLEGISLLGELEFEMTRTGKSKIPSWVYTCQTWQIHPQKEFPHLGLYSQVVQQPPSFDDLSLRVHLRGLPRYSPNARAPDVMLAVFGDNRCLECTSTKFNSVKAAFKVSIAKHSKITLVVLDECPYASKDRELASICLSWELLCLYLDMELPLKCGNTEMTIFPERTSASIAREFGIRVRPSITTKIDILDDINMYIVSNSAAIVQKWKLIPSLNFTAVDGTLLSRGMFSGDNVHVVARTQSTGLTIFDRELPFLNILHPKYVLDSPLGTLRLGTQRCSAVPDSEEAVRLQFVITPKPKIGFGSSISLRVLSKDNIPVWKSDSELVSNTDPIRFGMFLPAGISPTSLFEILVQGSDLARGEYVIERVKVYSNWFLSDDPVKTLELESCDIFCTSSSSESEFGTSISVSGVPENCSCHIRDGHSILALSEYGVLSKYLDKILYLDVVRDSDSVLLATVSTSGAELIRGCSFAIPGLSTHIVVVSE